MSIAADRIGRDPEAIPAWMALAPRPDDGNSTASGPLGGELIKEHARNARRPGDKRREPDELVISTGDPEAVPGRDKEKVFRPLYNVQVVQDTSSPLILGYEVFAQATDAGTLMPSRRRAQALTGV